MFAQEVLPRDIKAAAIEELEVAISNFITGEVLAPLLQACEMDPMTRAGMLAARATVAALLSYEMGGRLVAEQDADQAEADQQKIESLEGQVDAYEVAMLDIEAGSDKTLAAKGGHVVPRRDLESINTVAKAALKAVNEMDNEPEK